MKGITEDIPEINNVQVDIGRSITREEGRRHVGGFDRERHPKDGSSKVDPIGKTIEIEGRPTKWSEWRRPREASSGNPRTIS